MKSPRRARILWLLALPLIAFAAACAGGNAPDAAAPVAADAGSDQAGQADQTDQADQASPGEAVDEAAAATSAASLADAVLTGAPVPPPAARAVEAGAAETVRGGRFPPLNDPRVVLPEAATWLNEDTLVLGGVQNADARAYPVFMMTFHHVANDTLGGLPYLVTF